MQRGRGLVYREGPNRSRGEGAWPRGWAWLRGKGRGLEKRGAWPRPGWVFWGKFWPFRCWRSRAPWSCACATTWTSCCGRPPLGRRVGQNPPNSPQNPPPLEPPKSLRFAPKSPIGGRLIDSCQSSPRSQRPAALPAPAREHGGEIWGEFGGFWLILGGFDRFWGYF